MNRFKKNVGPTDAKIRIIIGIGLFSLLFLLEEPLKWIGLIGFIPLLTALKSTCPLYSLFGISTSKTKEIK